MNLPPTVSEYCCTHHVQRCHTCDDANCGDNTNPGIVALKVEVKRLKESNEAWSIQSEALSSELRYAIEEIKKLETALDFIMTRWGEAPRPEQCAKCVQIVLEARKEE